MRRRLLTNLILAILLSVVALAPAKAAVQPEASPESPEAVFAPRLLEIYSRRAGYLLSENPPVSPLEAEYDLSVKSARWALQHEIGKLHYVEQWAANRGVRVVEAEPTLRVKHLADKGDRVRFYVAQTLKVGYQYPGEDVVNRFGAGSRHILELKRSGDQWLIAMEWYLDPLGDDSEIPDVTPALLPAPLAPPLPSPPAAAEVHTAAAVRGYDREGAVQYADQYCGLAWGCGNNHRYNPRYRDYNGMGGDCTNYISQAIHDGGKLRIAIHAQVAALSSALQSSGRAAVSIKAPFRDLWERTRGKPGGMSSLLRRGDLIGYYEKGKLSHFAIVTGFDSRGYPLIDSHTCDRYHTPFDMGWDRKTIYWFFRMRD